MPNPTDKPEFRLPEMPSCREIGPTVPFEDVSELRMAFQDLRRIAQQEYDARVAAEGRVGELQALLDAITTPNVSYFDMTPAEEIARLEAKLSRYEAAKEGEPEMPEGKNMRLVDFEGALRAWGHALQDRVAALKVRVEDLERENAELRSRG